MHIPVIFRLFPSALLLLVAACTKEESGRLVIEGVRNLDFARAGDHKLDLTVKQISGRRERVTLSITGLPSDAAAGWFMPASGSPDFSTSLLFEQPVNHSTGTFPVTLTGSSASGQVTYDMTIRVPK